MHSITHLPIPISVNWNLTNLCNFTCSHCYSQEIRKELYELPTELTKKVISKLSAAKINLITFGGGEGFLRHDIWDLFSFCNENKINKRIITNGFLINDEICQLIKKYNVSEVLISLDGYDSYIHDDFRNKPGSFVKVINAIELFKRHSIPFMVLTSINRKNYFEFERFFDLIKELSPECWRINDIKNFGIDKQSFEELEVEIDDLKNVYQKIYNFSREWRGNIIYDSIFCECFSPSGNRSILEGCHCGKLSLGIRSNGDVVPCVYFEEVIGNILKDDIIDIWKESVVLKRIRNRQPIGKCRNCQHWKRCKGGCFARAYLKNGDINTSDPLCWMKNE